MSNGAAVHLEFDRNPTAQSVGKIRAFSDIPDIMQMTITPADYLVDGLIARKSLTLWAGVDGTAKTLHVLRMGIAVATGGQFVGRRCQKAPVLFLDYENPDFEVRRRLEIMAGGPVPDFKVWGTWLEQQPPQIGSELLLEIAKQVRPLLVFDPFRYAHLEEENDSTAMMRIMQCLRDDATAGAAVLILHHPAKTEGSTGRGSTAIRGAVDVAFLQERSDETDLVTIRCMKNRFGERSVTTIRPDWEQYSFEVIDSPQFTKRSAELDRLHKAITEEPGLSQNAICERSGMTKQRAMKLLKEGMGCLWTSDQGKNRSLRYYPAGSSTRLSKKTTCGDADQKSASKEINNLGWFPAHETTKKTTEPLGNGCVVSWFSPLKGETTEPPHPAAVAKAKTLPSCPACGSFALYREKDGTFTCETCSSEKAFVN